MVKYIYILRFFIHIVSLQIDFMYIIVSIVFYCIQYKYMYESMGYLIFQSFSALSHITEF